MKKTLALLVAAVASLVLLAAGQASASMKTVTVVMHDPGCHWFAVGGKFTKTLSVKGPIALANFDENTLIVAGPNGTKLDKIGKKLVLARGVYRITMVKQAPDDNHLKLVVK
jgi:hypothetical protein